MRNFIVFCLFFTAGIFVFAGISQHKIIQAQNQPALTIPVKPPPPKKPFLAIRLLVIKHSPGGMANHDGSLAVKAANEAAAKGLNIKVIGNVEATNFTEIQDIINREMMDAAVYGDTLIIHTIGHGAPQGSLDNIGKRDKVLKAIANAAEANQQKVLWWELSCFASADIHISDMTEAQQQLVSVYASSSATEESTTDRQAWLMSHVFMALADKDNNLDQNNNSLITGNELKQFLNGLDNEHAGDTLFTKNFDDPIFGQLVYELYQEYCRDIMEKAVQKARP